MIIECGKQSTQMTRLISGLIRQKGYTRGADRKVLYTLSGSSTAIRFNERVSYFVREAAKLTQDGITIDINDPNMKADTLLQSALNIASESVYYNATAVANTSNVENFIPSVAIEYGELQDIINLIEEQSNGEAFIDINDVVQFRHQLQPPVIGKGFTIKNKKTTVDNADDTCYLVGKNWDYQESCLKSDSYSNRLFGILPAETVPSTKEDMGFGSTFIGQYAATTSGNQEYRQKFRPTHSHFLPGDIIIVGHQIGTTGPSWTTRFRIASDSGGGIVANIDFSSKAFPDPIPTATGSDMFQVINEQIFYNSANARIDSFDLDTTQNYWLISSNDNIPGGNGFNWAVKGPGSATGFFQNTTSGQSTNSNGGSGWVIAPNGLQGIFSLPRRRSQAFYCQDPKAMSALAGSTNSALGLIESTLANTPAVVKTREGLYKYMTNQLYYMARPRTNWNMATVTAPNVPIFPGDPIMISDSVLGFSTAGSQVVMTTCGDMTYSWSIGDYQAPTILSIQPVGLPTRYR